MYIIDITTMANYFGRITGITRVESKVAEEFLNQFPEQTQFVYWSNDKNSFERYNGELSFEKVKSAKLSRDFSCSHDSYFQEAIANEPSDAQGCFVVTGSGWLQNSKYATGCISFARIYDLKLTFYIHDLIPVKFPFYYEASYVRTFSESLSLIASSGSLLLCNSKNTETDLLGWCEHKGIDAPTTEVAYLGDSIAPTIQHGEETADIEPENYVLTVGAIHRRKNYELLASVWRRLKARMGGSCPKLKIVGGVTPDGKMLHTELLQDPVLCNCVEIISGVDDKELDRLYRHARLVVYPSHYEGWGLPVAEALAYGKVCLASNSSAIPEIANLGGDFLSPDDPVSWASRIMFYCQSSEQRKKREHEVRELYQPRTWADTVARISKSLDKYSKGPAPIIYPGETKRFNSSQGDCYLASPCYAMESWGRWCMQSTLKLKFTLPETERKNLILKIGLNSRSNTPGQILLNGVVVSSNRPFYANMRQYYQELPEDLLESENTVEISLSAVSRLPDQKKGEHAKRYSAFGVEAFSIFTENQLRYYFEDVFGSPDQLHEFPFEDKRASNVLCGRVGQNAIQTVNGTVSINLVNVVPQLWDMRSVAFFKIPKDKNAIVTIRLNGFILDQALVKPDRHGQTGCNFVLPRGADDYRTLEFFFMSEDAGQKLNGALTALFLPSTMLPHKAVPSSDQLVPRHQFLKFGTDVQDAQYDILLNGWDTEERFGVSCQSTGLMSLRVAGNEPVRSLKLHCKVIGVNFTDVALIVNGTRFDLTVHEDVAMHIIDLPAILQPNDDLDAQVVISEGKFVLRSIQLL
ncbi:glycosyltransferase family 4 protein [Epibacterium sp. DP7N7-1]|nr:glycosyltransferase family 4 protein [Epibacterium sp. DP7N7-1]